MSASYLWFVQEMLHEYIEVKICNGIMNNDNCPPHALVSSDVTRNTFTTNCGLIMGMQFGPMAVVTVL